MESSYSDCIKRNAGICHHIQWCFNSLIQSMAQRLYVPYVATKTVLVLLIIWILIQSVIKFNVLVCLRLLSTNIIIVKMSVTELFTCQHLPVQARLSFAHYILKGVRGLWVSPPQRFHVCVVCLADPDRLYKEIQYINISLCCIHFFMTGMKSEWLITHIFEETPVILRKENWMNCHRREESCNSTVLKYQP